MTETGRRLLRFVGLTAAAGALIFAFSGSFGSHSTPVKEAWDRKPMPDFTLPAIDGRTWSLSDHRGKVVLVNFWATWCPPCRTETPELVRVHERYREQGLELVGISLDDEPELVVPGFIKRFRMPYPVLIPTPDFSLARQIESLPTTVLVDREGRIATVHFGAVRESDLRGDLELLLGERPQ
jgi:peroxiredoxin